MFERKRGAFKKVNLNRRDLSVSGNHESNVRSGGTIKVPTKVKDKYLPSVQAHYIVQHGSTTLGTRELYIMWGHDLRVETNSFEILVPF